MSWTYKGKEITEIPDEYEGFVYLITNLTNNHNYIGKKLAKFKIPKKIFFVTEIPKGATGKLQRNVLAKKFGLNN